MISFAERRRIFQKFRRCETCDTGMDIIQWHKTCGKSLENLVPGSGRLPQSCLPGPKNGSLTLSFADILRQSTWLGTSKRPARKCEGCCCLGQFCDCYIGRLR